MTTKPSRTDADLDENDTEMTFTRELELRSKYIHAHIERVMRQNHVMEESVAE